MKQVIPLARRRKKDPSSKQGFVPALSIKYPLMSKPKPKVIKAATEYRTPHWYKVSPNSPLKKIIITKSSVTKQKLSKNLAIRIIQSSRGELRKLAQVP